MDEFEQIKALVGKDVTKEDLRYVDCYVHHKIGLFIPSMGACQYAARPNHTHPAYMFTVYFSEGVTSTGSMKPKENYYRAIGLSPNIPHQDTENQQYYCILIEKEYFEQQYQMYGGKNPCFNSIEFLVCQDILKTLNMFIFEISKHMQNAEITLEAQMTLITHWLIRSIIGESYDMRSISSHYAVARAQHYIEQHFNKAITVKQLAELGNMSTSNFNRIFKKELHITPFEYLIETRIEKAKNLLRRQDLPITEIAMRCGFGSSAHFSSKFSELVGVTPSEYRKGYGL